MTMMAPFNIANQEDEEALTCALTSEEEGVHVPGFRYKRLMVSVSLALAAVATAGLAWHGGRPQETVEYAQPIQVDDLISEVQTQPTIAQELKLLQSDPLFKGVPSTVPAARCIACAAPMSPSGCSLDNGKTWKSCPAVQPYFAESRMACVASVGECYAPAPPPAGNPCLECYKSPCTVAGVAIKCDPAHPYYDISQKLCAFSCVQSGVPTPAPSWPTPAPSWPPAAPPVVMTAAPLSKTTAAPSVCATVTTTTCMLMACGGDMTCNKNYKCECKPSSCVDNSGSCSKPGSSGFSPAPGPTSTPLPTCNTVTDGTCQLLGCGSSRGPVDCSKKSQCVCQPGYCTDKSGSKCVKV